MNVVNSSNRSPREEEDPAKRKERLDQEFNEWIEKNNLFFEKRFFPAAEKHETLQRLVNVALDKGQF
jgi:hypothetical protein